MSNQVLIARSAQLMQSAARPIPQRRNRQHLPLAFWCLLLTACLLRSAGLDRPLLGHYASKSTLYGMIARNWARGLAPVWQPTVDCLVGGQRGAHMIEFPVSAYVAGAAWRIAGGSLDAWGRSLSAAISVAGVALMYWLVRRWHGEPAALAAGWMLALSPVSIIYGQSFMLEASIVFLTLATLLAWDHWLAKPNPVCLALAACSFALLLLTKIYMLVLLIPLVALAMSAGMHCRPKQVVLTALAMAAAVLPAALWYAYAWQATLPGGALAATTFFSLHDAAGKHRWPALLWFSADFYRQLLDDLTGPTLTCLGAALALAGLLHPQWRRHLPWLGSMALLVFLLPLKFYKMNYYDVVVLPPLAVLVGLGWQTLHDRLPLSRKAAIGLLAAGLLLSLRYAALPAFTTPVEDRGVLAAARAVARHSAADEPVVTIHGTSFDLLYYCDRAGWALPIDDDRLAEKLAACRAQGARLLAIADVASLAAHPAADALLSRMRLVESGDDFRLYRLDTAAMQIPESPEPPQR
jgi:4-amino-4-deoxy-L-arabinose transferase-like glycosyltransferase